MTVLMITLSIWAVLQTPAQLKAIFVTYFLIPAYGPFMRKRTEIFGGSVGSGTGHVISDSSHDDKSEQTDNRANER